MGALVLAQRWLAAPSRCEACAGLCWVMTQGGPDACLLCYRRMGLRYISQPRVCIEPGCGTIYKPQNAQQLRCHEHSHARLLGKALPPKKCAHCEREFTPLSNAGKYCTPSCRRSAEVRALEVARRKKYGHRECKCGAVFVPINDANRRCRDCTSPSGATPVSAPAQKLPCSRCRHGALNDQAELGVECQAGLWMRCKPLVHALFFAAQDVEEGAS